MLKKCSSCGKRKADVKKRVNPYILDVYGKTRKQKICLACIHEMIMDI